MIDMIWITILCVGTCLWIACELLTHSTNDWLEEFRLDDEDDMV